MKHLQKIVLPVFKRNIPTTSIRSDLLVSSLTDLIISSSTQNINQQSETYLLLSTQNGGKSFLYQYRTVETLRRILADITVFAIMIHRFAEIIKQNSTATNLTLGILLHTLKFFIVYILLTTILSKSAKCDNITHLIEQNCFTRQTVSTSTSYLLIIILDTFRHVIMHDKTHIAFVYTHAKGYCSTNDINLIIYESFLDTVSFKGRQPSMVCLCTHTFFFELLRHALCSLST